MTLDISGLAKRLKGPFEGWIILQLLLWRCFYHHQPPTNECSCFTTHSNLHGLTYTCQLQNHETFRSTVLISSVEQISLPFLQSYWCTVLHYLKWILVSFVFNFPRFPQFNSYHNCVFPKEKHHHLILLATLLGHIISHILTTSASTISPFLNQKTDFSALPSPSASSASLYHSRNGVMHTRNPRRGTERGDTSGQKQRRKHEQRWKRKDTGSPRQFFSAAFSHLPLANLEPTQHIPMLWNILQKLRFSK